MSNHGRDLIPSWPTEDVGADQSRARSSRQSGRVIDANPDVPLSDLPIRRWFSVSDIVTLALHSRWLLLAGLVLGGGCGAVITQVLPPQYDASTVLLAHDADGTLEAEMSIARSDRVLRNVVQAVGVNRILTGLSLPEPFNLLWPACPSSVRLSTDCAMAAVNERLVVGLDGLQGGQGTSGTAFHPLAQPTGQTARALRLTFTAPDAELALAVLNSIVDADRNARHDDYLPPSAETLQPNLARVKQAIADDEAEMGRIQGEANVLNIANDIASITAQASDIAQRDSAIRERQSAVQAQMAKVSDAMPSIPQRVLDSQVESNADASGDARSTLLTLQLERAHLAALYAQGYPGLVEIDRKIRTAQAAIRAQSHSVSTINKVVRNPAYDAAADRLQALQREAGALAQQHAELQRQQTTMNARFDVLRHANARLAEIRLRQETESAVMRQLTMQMATLGSTGSLTTAQVDSVQVLRAPFEQPAPSVGLGIRAGVGALVGLLLGVVAAIIAAKRRSVYVVAREVERHLRLRELVQLVVWRRGVARDVTQEMQVFTTSMADAMDDRGTPLSVVHLVGTAARDGGDLIANAMAGAFALSRGKRVLVFQLDGSGRWDIQSYGVSTDAAAPNSIRAQSIAAQGPPAASLPHGGMGEAPGSDAAVRVARALMGDGDAIGGQSRLQIARLRGMHDMVLVVSAYDVTAAVTRSLSVLADLNVVVVRAMLSPSYLAKRVCNRLSAAGGRTLGFVFTSDQSFSSSRSIQCG